MSDADLARTLSQIELFDGLEAEQIRHIAVGGSERVVAAGETLTEPGNVDECLWAFLGGRLRIETRDGVVIREVVKPRVLGEMGVLIGEARDSRIVGVEQTRLHELPVATLASLVEEDPGLGHRLLGNLCRTLYGRLHHSNNENSALRRRLSEVSPDDPLLNDPA